MHILYLMYCRFIFLILHMLIIQFTLLSLNIKGCFFHLISAEPHYLIGILSNCQAFAIVSFNTGYAVPCDLVLHLLAYYILKKYKWQLLQHYYRVQCYSCIRKRKIFCYEVKRKKRIPVHIFVKILLNMWLRRAPQALYQQEIFQIIFGPLYRQLYLRRIFYLS